MTGLIPRDFVKVLLARTDIVSLINTRIKLKKQGKNYQAHCPFHYEKIPSFTVNIERQFYYCFGCGAHGNVIDFLMNYDRLEFVESIEELASYHSIEIPYETATNKNYKNYHQKNNLYQLMHQLSSFYQKTLQSNLAVEARRYLQQRGFSKEIIHKFAIGFAPSGWDYISKYFVSSITDRSSLINIGMMVVSKKGRVYDRFRERIMFPIRDKRGRVVAFGGRVLKNGQPKYLNSPETDIFCKSRYLYGLYEAQKKSEQFRLLIVEGYLDVVTLSQFGIDYAVASLGTSINAEHIQILYRTTDLVICCYDGDRAGQEAAWRVLKNALPYLIDGRQLRFMFLPDGEDPDTLIRKIGKEAFEQQIKHAQPFSTFLFKKLLSQVDLSTLDGRAKFSSIALPLINQVPGVILRLYLRQKLGKIIGILDESQLEKLLPKITMRRRFILQPRIKHTIMRMLIGLLVQNPWLSTLVTTLKGLIRSGQPGISLFIKLVQVCQAQPGLTTAQLLEQFRENKFFLQLEMLASWNHMIVDEMVKTTFVDTLTKLHNSVLERRQESLIAFDRIRGLTLEERHELWLLNQTLAKK
ncbi:DNA primase [Sodalis sp. CWE]|uniref:DNA primase n=1 Tax=Sodalis sp. CWE TaxID=2803816 RepID=UPI001C7E0E5C|nr:DNA primase [Sodalis sp. CWE]MBX4180830.1 DNA primase [Sodalis sp. CWE]